MKYDLTETAFAIVLILVGISIAAIGLSSAYYLIVHV